MRRNIQRFGLIGGLIVFALAWTILMGLGVKGVSPGAAAPGSASGSPAASLGAGAHIMYVDDSSFPAVTVYLAVNDANGRVVPGLQQDDFTLREDGAAVDITDFVGAGGGSSSTMLVIDQSGSMGDEDKLAGAIRAAQTYVNLLKPGADQLGVIVFSDFAVTLAPLGEVTEQGRTILNSLLAALFPLSGTEFYAATREAIAGLKNVGGRKVVLALTDGMDNNGQVGLPQTVQAALEASTPVYTVGLGSDADRQALERLARETEGQAYFSPSAAELEELYGKIASGLRNEYALTYQSLTPNLDGTQRALDVAITTGREDLQAGGGYAVGGILASGLNLGLFLPTLLVLLAALAGLYVAPSLRRGDDKRKREDTAGKNRADSARAGSAEPTPPAPLPPVPSPPVASPPVASPPVVSPPVVSPPAPLPPVASPPVASPPVSACLVVTHPVLADTLAGSAAGSTLLLPAASVAPRQARIYLDAGRYAIDDLAGCGSTLVSYGGDPAQLRAVQRNALRDGSLVQLGGLRFVFHVGAQAPSLEQRVVIPPGGLQVGTAPTCDVVVAGQDSAQAHLARVRFDGRNWLVERLAGACAVSYGGSLDQMRPVNDCNALKPGSSLLVGGVLLHLEAA